MVAEGVLAIGGFLPNPYGHHGYTHSTDIRHHVCCVCQNCQRVGDNTSSNFDNHEEKTDSDYDSKFLEGDIALFQLLLESFIVI